MRNSPPLFLAVLVLLVLALAACGEDAKPIPSSTGASSVAPPRPTPSASADSSGGAPAEGAIDVLGKVVDEAGDAVVGREITLVDARGRPASILTDDGGSFFFRAVVAPYDVGIASTPSRAHAGPSAYLGLAAAGPRFVVVEHDGPAERAAAQTVRVAVDVPACHAPSCWVAVVTSSPSGRGQVARALGPNERAVVFDVDHAWSLGTVPPSEAIDVHVLTGDEGYSELAYAHVGGVMARAGGAADVTVAPARLAATPPITISARGAAVPPAWEWTIATRLRLPGGATMALHYVAGPVLVTRLPRIDGAAIEAGAWAQAPGGGDAAVAQRSSFAWSLPAPLTASQILLDVPAPLDIVRPGVDGRVSRRAAVVWSRAGAGLVMVDLDTADGRRVVHAYTAGDRLSFARLSALGIARPDPGDHVVAVTSYADATLDDVVAANDERAPSRVGTTRPGTVSYERVRFQIVP